MAPNARQDSIISIAVFDPVIFIITPQPLGKLPFKAFVSDATAPPEA
jgi:hypothetical protein